MSAGCFVLTLPLSVAAAAMEGAGLMMLLRGRAAGDAQPLMMMQGLKVLCGGEVRHARLRCMLHASAMCTRLAAGEQRPLHGLLATLCVILRGCKCWSESKSGN